MLRTCDFEPMTDADLYATVPHERSRMVDVAYGMEWWHVRSAAQIFGLEVLGSVAEIRAHLVVHHPFASKAILNQPVPDHSYRIWGLGAELNPSEAFQGNGIGLVGHGQKP